MREQGTHGGAPRLPVEASFRALKPEDGGEAPVRTEDGRRDGVQVGLALAGCLGPTLRADLLDRSRDLPGIGERALREALEASGGQGHVAEREQDLAGRSRVR